MLLSEEKHLSPNIFVQEHQSGNSGIWKCNAWLNDINVVIEWCLNNEWCFCSYNWFSFEKGKIMAFSENSQLRQQRKSFSFFLLKLSLSGKYGRCLMKIGAWNWNFHRKVFLGFFSLLNHFTKINPKLCNKTHLTTEMKILKRINKVKINIFRWMWVMV